MVCQQISLAANSDVDWILTPEVTNCISTSRTRQSEVLTAEAQDQMLLAVQREAQRHSVNVLLGSLALKAEEGGGAPFVNRSVLVNRSGDVVARYDKIHMFDVQISDTETYQESAGYQRGDTAVIGMVDGMPIGLSICYDVRFPALYRALAEAGAKVITVPSAFSPETGPAHWATLLRARAIETGCYVVAPAQTGKHGATRGRSRVTYGHSLVVDPWGKVVLDAGNAPGLFVAELDLSLVDVCRRKLPSLSHSRTFRGPL